jgi:hypothetical protein
MTTTAEFSQLLDAFTAASDELIALTNARAEKLGIDPAAEPVPIDSSHEELIIAYAKYEDAWQKVSKAADTLWVKEPNGRELDQSVRDYAYDHEALADEPND